MPVFQTEYDNYRRELWIKGEPVGGGPLNTSISGYFTSIKDDLLEEGVEIRIFNFDGLCAVIKRGEPYTSVGKAGKGYKKPGKFCHHNIIEFKRGS